MDTELVERISRFKKEYGATNLLIAKVSGISKRTLVGYNGKFWRPSKRTKAAISAGLDRIEAAIHRPERAKH